MRSLRLAIVALVSVAMLALGAVACTPEQRTQVEEIPAAIVAGIAWLIGTNLLLAFFQGACSTAPPDADCGP